MSVSLEQIYSAIDKLAHAQKELMHEQQLIKEELKQLSRAEEADKNDSHHIVPFVEETHYEIKRLHNMILAIHTDMQKHFHIGNMEDED